MRMLRKILAILFAAAILLTLFAGCSNLGKCDNCGKTSTKLKELDAQGKTMKLCPDCYDAIEIKGTCDNCGRSEQTLKHLTLSGTVKWFCPDCYKVMSLLAD